MFTLRMRERDLVKYLWLDFLAHYAQHRASKVAPYALYAILQFICSVAYDFTNATLCTSANRFTRAKTATIKAVLGL